MSTKMLLKMCFIIKGPYLITLDMVIEIKASWREEGLILLVSAEALTSRVTVADPVDPVDAQHLLEAPLKVVRQKAVEQRIGTAVDVGQDDSEKVDAGDKAVLWEGADQVEDVENEKWQPAQDKYHHDDHHHSCHFLLRLAAFGESRSHTGRLYLDYNKQVTQADDQKWAEET